MNHYLMITHYLTLISVKMKYLQFTYGQVGNRVLLLSMNEAWKLQAHIVHIKSRTYNKEQYKHKQDVPKNFNAHQDRITNKEDGRVVSSQVPVALLCVELNCKATRIASCIS
jgi:hypothetical protein